MVGAYLLHLSVVNFLVQCRENIEIYPNISNQEIGVINTTKLHCVLSCNSCNEDIKIPTLTLK